MGRRKGKFLTPQAVTGQRGVQLIERIITDRGWLFTQTTQHTDGGVDGYLEVVDGKGERTNHIIQVQSKATGQPWPKESNESFEYRVRERDLHYWLQGNTPIILVLSRPNTDEAYWINVKEYFNSAQRRKGLMIIVDKATQRFVPEALESLLSFSSPVSLGIYLGTPQVKETLLSNFLPLETVPPFIFSADCLVKRVDKILDQFRINDAYPTGTWFFVDGRILSFHSLEEPEWNGLLDLGTLERNSSADWQTSNDAAKRREFVGLLNTTLRAQLRSLGVRRRTDVKDKHIYFFGPEGDKVERQRTWTKEVKQSSPHVVKALKAKKAGHIIAYKHLGFEGQFRYFGNKWYLVVTPTYHYTRDGQLTSKYGESYLSGIKRREKNFAVDGSLKLWIDLFTVNNVFDRSKDYLGFATPMNFKTEFGVPESAWTKSKPKVQSSPKQTQQQAVREKRSAATLDLFGNGA